METKLQKHANNNNNKKLTKSHKVDSEKRHKWSEILKKETKAGPRKNNVLGNFIGTKQLPPN